MKDVPNSSFWESSMSGDVLQALMEGFKPQNLIHGDGQEDCFAIDNVKSRYNGVIQPPWPFAKLSILDIMIPYDENMEMKGEYLIFIDAGKANGDDAFDFMCYQKAMFYPYERARFIVEQEAWSEEGPITKAELQLISLVFHPVTWLCLHAPAKKRPWALGRDLASSKNKKTYILTRLVR